MAPSDDANPSKIGSVHHSVPLRWFSDFAGPENSPASNEDHVDPDDPQGELEIYRGILSTQIKLVKGFSLTTSVIGLAFQPVLYVHAQVTRKGYKYIPDIIETKLSAWIALNYPGKGQLIH